MEKTSEQIKLAVELEYTKISEAQESLEQIRLACPHKKERETNYSYRPGVSMPAIVCDDCGELLKLL